LLAISYVLAIDPGKNLHREASVSELYVERFVAMSMPTSRIASIAFGSNPARHGSSAEQFKAVSGVVTQQAFGHLAPGRISRAEDEDSFLSDVAKYQQFQMVNSTNDARATL